MRPCARTNFRPVLGTLFGAEGLEDRRLLSGSGMGQGFGATVVGDGAEAEGPQLQHASTVPVGRSQPILANDGEILSGVDGETSSVATTGAQPVSASKSGGISALRHQNLRRKAPTPASKTPPRAQRRRNRE